MKKNETCAHGRNAPHDVLKNLHPSQGGGTRHKCVVCAYEMGFEAGFIKRMGIASINDKEEVEKCYQDSSAPKSVLKQLPNSQAGTGRHKCGICAYKQGYETALFQTRLEPKDIPINFSIRLNSFPDVDDESLSVKEGRRKWVQHLRRERNPKIVKAKKAQVLKKTGHLKCEVCEFDFKERYGMLGANFCEAHHKQPLSTLNEQTETKLNDLAILCSNCHRMIHRTKPVMSIIDFKRLLATIRDK